MLHQSSQGYILFFPDFLELSVQGLIILRGDWNRLVGMIKVHISETCALLLEPPLHSHSHHFRNDLLL